MKRFAKRYDAEACKKLCFNKKLVQKIKAKMLSPDELRLIESVFSIMGNSTRLKILFSLFRAKELCVCDIAHILGMSVYAVSHQLRKLRDRNIVNRRSDGVMVYYSLSNDPCIKRLLKYGLCFTRMSVKKQL